MKNSQKGFVVPLLIAIIAVLVIGGGVYIYETKKAETPVSDISTVVQTTNQTQPTNVNTQYPPVTTTTNNQSQPASNSKLPIISTITPSVVPIGGKIKVIATNLDPLGGWVGNGWISNTHTSLYLKNSSGQSQILWSGNEPDNSSTQVTNTINVVIPPQQPCVISSATGGCAQGAYQIVPGQYSVYVSVDGRGMSTAVPITITASPALTPNISSVISANVSNQFYPGSQVVITGSNFPADGKTQPIIWIDSTKVTDVTGLISATPQQIVFTAPAAGILSPGVHNLYISGIVGRRTADPENPGVAVQSNTVSVTILPTLVINSVYPSTVSVGNTFSISGKGFQSQNSSQVEVEVHNLDIHGPTQAGIAWVGWPTSDTSISFAIPSQYCSLGGSPNVACTQETQLIPGNYTVQVYLSASDVNSNTLNFTVR